MFDNRSLEDFSPEWGEHVERCARANGPKPTVYFIGWEGGPIKIGWTTREIQHRFHQIQAHCPYDLKVFAVREGPQELELAYHDRFRDWRIRGEWFEPCWLLLNEIGKLSGTVRGYGMVFPPRGSPERRLAAKRRTSPNDTGV